jgi:hypothetical protein
MTGNPLLGRRTSGWSRAGTCPAQRDLGLKLSAACLCLVRGEFLIDRQSRGDGQLFASRSGGSRRTFPRRAPAAQSGCHGRNKRIAERFA